MGEGGHLRSSAFSCANGIIRCIISRLWVWPLLSPNAGGIHNIYSRRPLYLKVERGGRRTSLTSPRVKASSYTDRLLGSVCTEFRCETPLRAKAVCAVVWGVATRLATTRPGLRRGAHQRNQAAPGRIPGAHAKRSARVFYRQEAERNAQCSCRQANSLEIKYRTPTGGVAR